MEKLRVGFQKFSKEMLPKWASHFSKLAEGQRPSVLLITCSDSRIDPGLLYQTDPGEIFVIRNAGNIVPAAGNGSGGEIATIEFAIKALGVPHVLVCGHSHCGAMGALLDPDSAASLGHVCSWIEHAKGAMHDGDDLDTVIQNNVLLQLEHLRSHDFVREAEEAGKIELHGWVYRFETGEILEYNPKQDRFIPLADDPSTV